MAKSHKKKGKKQRSKTTLPPVKDGSKQNATKNIRSNSIPPANQQKQHRKKIVSKKPSSICTDKNDGKPIQDGAVIKQVYKTVPHSTPIVDAFSNLSISDKKRPEEKPQSKRRLSTDATVHGKNGSRKDGSNLSSLENIAKLILSGKAKNIIIMAGAGVSTGSGIPDFRTPGTGLYDNLKKYQIPSPTAIFDLDYFHDDPKPFFALAKELYPSGKYKPCLPHYFVKLLHDKGVLLRMYTQNIDGLERTAGIPSEKLVEAHGTFSTASCTRCGKKQDGLEVKNKVLNGIVPRCSSSGLCWGVVKPDIVFFGEDLPRRFYYFLKDFPSCDLLIVMGTSLEVEPFAGLTASVRYNCPRLLLNRELVGPFRKRGHGRRSNDIGIDSDLAESINRFANLLGWQEELGEVMEASKVEETTEGKSDAGSSDSGVSCPESSGDSVRSRPTSSSLLPPTNDIKRYFHTVRSTPLPKFSGSSSGSSYFNFISKNSYRPAAGKYNSNTNSSLAIQYAETIPGKKCNKPLPVGKVRTFGVRLQKSSKYDDSDSTSASTSEEPSSESCSALTSDDSSS